MKKSKYLLSIILVVIFIFSTAAPAAAVDYDRLEAREVTTYLYSMDKTTTLTLLFDPDLPEAPYIDVTDYFGIVFKAEFEFSKNDDGTYSLSDDFGELIIDAEADTVIINNLETVMIYGVFPPEGSMVNPSSYSISDSFIFEKPNPLVLDLDKYGFDIIDIYGVVYFPVCILNDIMVRTYLAAEYIDGCLYFTDTYLFPDGYFDRSSVHEKSERSLALAEFTYNELCFQFDNFYGRPANAIASKYIEKYGFDKALDTYSDETRLAKQLLMSTSKVDFYIGLNILSAFFNDGGHTVMFAGTDYDVYEYPGNAIYNAFVENFNISDEEKWTLAANSYYYSACKLWKNKNNNVIPTKNECLKKYEKALEWDDIASLIICGSTAVFSFDGFFDEVIEPFVLSLDYAKEHGVKNFVIDISTNGGGMSAVIEFITAMITNKNTHDAASHIRTLYQNTKSLAIDNRLADLNLDGEIDEADKDVIYDFDFAILTTSATFSAANTLACLAKENGIMIIGEKSGGGSCATAKLYTPTSDYYMISYYEKYVYENGEDMDKGAEVDVDLRKPYTGDFNVYAYGMSSYEEAGFYDYQNLYDLEALGKYMDEFYDKGDVNGDGAKNNKDVIELFNYVSEDNEYAAKYDINSNGKINNKDVFALFKKVSAA